MSDRPNEEGYMQQHLCACVVDLNNERFTTVAFDVTNPVPWPEIRVLQEVHGEEAIYDIMPVSLGSRQSASREKERMILKYGRDVVESVYAGKAFQMEWFMPGWPINPAKASRNQRKAATSDRPKPKQYRAPDAEATDSRV